MFNLFPRRRHGGAWARCTFAYRDGTGPTTEPVHLERRTDDKIVPARGPPNLGWDPVLQAEDTGLTCVSTFSTVPADRHQELMGKHGRN